MTLISKEKRNKIVEHYKNKWENCKLSKKSLGIMMRSFHMSTPVFFILIALLAPKHVVWVVVFLLVVIFFMFFIFDGCILSMIENKVCNDDFTIADPFLEVMEWDKNTKNRFNVTLVVGSSYYILIGIIYYIRFF
jgi:uncharacterized membrane protein